MELDPAAIAQTKLHGGVLGGQAFLRFLASANNGGPSKWNGRGWNGLGTFALPPSFLCPSDTYPSPQSIIFQQIQTLDGLYNSYPFMEIILLAL